MWLRKFSYIQDFIFSVAKSFVGLSLNHTPCKIIKGIAIWGVRWLDIEGDVVAEIYCQMLALLAASLLIQGSTTSSRYLIWDFVLSEAMWEDKWRYNITIASNTQILWCEQGVSFSLIWIWSQIDPQTLWNFCIGIFWMNVQQYSIPLLNFCELHNDSS